MIPQDYSDQQALLRTLIVSSDINLQASSIGGDSLVYNDRSVYNRLYTLFTTPRRARLFVRSFGVDLITLLFEPCDDITAQRIRQELYTAVRQWEPGLISSYQSISVVADQDTGTYEVVVSVYAPDLAGGEENMNFSFIRPTQ